MKDVIVINIHIDNASNYAIKFRILEALNSGKPIVTNSYSKGDWEQGDFLTFNSAEHFVTTIDNLLASDKAKQELKSHYNKLWNKRSLDFLFETKLTLLADYLGA